MNTIERISKFYAIKSLDEKTFELLSDYENDGEYRLVTEEEMKYMDMDVRWDCSIHATYHALLLLLKYYNEGNTEVYDRLIRCLKKSIGFGFVFEGFMSEKATVSLLTELVKSQVYDIMPETERIRFEQIVDRYRKVRGETPEKEIIDLLKAYDDNLMFTYGTLMKGQYNHHYLLTSDYIGDAVLKEHGLMELGGFPGAVPMRNRWITGELYRVDKQTKENIDMLEGSLYSYKRKLVEMDGKINYPGVYEYNYKRFGEYPIRAPYGKWDKNSFDPEEYIAYAVYGSNLSDEGIGRYLDEYKHLDSRPYTIFHPLYFAKHSPRWNNMGVAFIDSEREGKSFSWIYVVSKKVFENIRDREGREWYDKVVDLGTDEYGVRIVTLTHSSKLTDTIPSQEYLDIIAYGISSRYGLTKREIEDYLKYDISKKVINDTKEG